MVPVDGSVQQSGKTQERGINAQIPSPRYFDRCQRYLTREPDCISATCKMNAALTFRAVLLSAGAVGAVDARAAIAHEAIEHLRQFVCVDADPLVGHANLHAAAV